MEPSWDDLQLFLAADEAGSFSEAARRLRIEQSTVSRRISKLEQALGGALFLRSRAGLTLTEQGERIRPLAKEAQQRIRELTWMAEPAVRGRVRLALTEGLALYGLIPRLSQLYARHPQLELELVTGYRVSDLTRREADLALRFVAPTRGDLVFRRIASLSLGLWAHRSLARGVCSSMPWIGLALDGVPTPEQDWMSAHQNGPARLVCNSIPSMVVAAESGLGVCLIADTLGAQTANLVRLPVDVCLSFPLYLVAHRASRHTPLVSALWTFLEEWAGLMRPEESVSR